MASERAPLRNENAASNSNLTGAQDGIAAHYGAVDDGDDDTGSFNLDDVSYRYLIRRYLVVVPPACVLASLTIVLAVHLTFKKTHTSFNDVVQRAVFPFIAAAVAWTAAHALKTPLWSWFAIFGWIGEALCTLLHVLSSEFLRFAVLILLRPRHGFPPKRIRPTPDLDVDFFQVVCWCALGWAAAEVVVAISQGYRQLSMYYELFGEPATYVPGDVEVESPLQLRSSELVPLPETGASLSEVMSLPRFIEDQLEHLLRVKYLTELEAAYGIPIPEIPIFIITLQRLDSIFVSLGLTLLLSSSIIGCPSPKAIHIILTFLITVVVHLLLSTLWTPRVLPKIGVHTAAYISFMASIVCIWAGLWRWGVVE